MEMETKMGKENLGNTSSQVFKKKCKNAIITLPQSCFEWQEKIISYLEHYKAFQYMLICEHDGPQKVHRHIYVQFENARTLDSRYLPGCHLEEALGSAQRCVEYLKAEDRKHKSVGVNSTVIYENGNMKLRGNVNTIGELKKITNIDEVPSSHLNTWLKVRSTKIKASDWFKKVKVIYMYGGSGMAKSLSIYRQLCFNHEEYFEEVKHIGEFWHGITGEVVDGVCVYDDFRDSHMNASEFVNFIDYHVHNLNYKGGSAKNKYHLILITSIQSPYEIYKKVGDEPRKQWLRRMKIINLNQIHTNLDDNNEPLVDGPGDAWLNSMPATPDEVLGLPDDPVRKIERFRELFDPSYVA